MKRQGRDGGFLYWVIIQAIRLDFFSQKGDSGSVVFDLDGQVWGIIDSGSGCNHALLDLTYLTPIKWIMEDIEASSFGSAVFL